MLYLYISNYDTNINVTDQMSDNKHIAHETAISHNPPIYSFTADTKT